MPVLPPFKHPKLPAPFMVWLEQIREILRPIPTYRRGAGSPEGVLNGNQGDRYFRTDGTPGTSMIYYKTTAGGNTGWQAYG